MMESQEFNLSVLENVTTFSTPLKNCSDYEAILSLIKEEVDIAQTEDEVEYQKCSYNKSRLRARRRDSESCDSVGIFKSPYKRNYSLKLKDPVIALISRPKCRAHENANNERRNCSAQRARSLGRVMPGRSLQSTYRKHCSSVSHSDTSGFSDTIENGKIINRETNRLRRNFDNDVKDEYEAEGKALEDLLTTAQEQVIVNGRVYEENLRVSSQGESTLLATTDLLDTGAVDDDSCVESLQNVTISDFRQELLNHRCTIGAKQKTAEGIKRNLNFDAPESEEENQNFTLTLSPEPTTRFNGHMDASSTLPCTRKRKESQDSIAGSLKNSTPNSCISHNQSEANSTTPRPRIRQTTPDSIASSLKNLTQDLRNMDPKREASATPPRPRKRKTSQDCISSLLKSSTPNSSNSHNKRETSSTPLRSRKRKTSDSSTVSSPKSSTRDPSNVDSANEASVTSPHPGKRKKNKSGIANSPKSVNQNFTNSDPKSEASATPPRPRNRKSSVASPLKGLTQELEKCIMNNDYERMCEEIDNNMETPSFTFETVQLLDEYDDCNQQANNKILSKVLSSPNSKTEDEAPRSVEHVGSSEDPLDYDPLYIAEAEDNEAATPSISKRKKNTVAKKRGSKRKISKADTSEESKRGSSKADTSDENKRRTNEDDTLETEGRRSGTRLNKKKRVSMTISDWEEEGDLSDEAAKVAKKVKAAKKRERLSLETLDKLDDIDVQLRHEVLPQHDIENRAGTAPLTYMQQMQFLKFASLNKDTYCPAEDEIIKRNWNAFCEDHDWDPENYKPFLQFKHGGHLIMSCMEQRRRFVQFLADGLANRPLYSVYSRFKILYTEYAAAGAWYSSEEDKKILAYMLHNPEKQPDTKCSELAKVLKRSRFSIWKRYRNLKAKENRGKKKKKVLTKVAWDLPLVTEFVTKLLDVTISEELIELKDAFIPLVVWMKLEKKIGIDHEFLKRSWDHQFHLQFFSPEPLSSNATKIRLIEYMWMKGIRHSKEIEWHLVVKYFEGCTIHFLRTMFNHLTAQASMVLESRNLSDIMKWLHTKKIERLRQGPKDKYLPRLRYVDKKVEFVSEDLMKATLTSNSASLD